MKNIIIDGIQITTAHFAQFEREEAIKRMIADGFVPGEDEAAQQKWAQAAYDKIEVESGKKPKAAKAEAPSVVDAQQSSHELAQISAEQAPEQAPSAKSKNK